MGEAAQDCRGSDVPAVTPKFGGKRIDFVEGAEEVELTAYWQRYESDIGFVSTFAAMRAVMNGESIGGGGVRDWDRLADKLTAIGRHRRVWRALRWMDQHGQRGHIIVLHRLYGLVPVEGYASAFGKLGCLASLTDGAEGAREELAYERSEARGAEAAAQQEDRRAAFETLFWQQAGELMKAEAAVARARVTGTRERAQAMARAVRQTLERAMLECARAEDPLPTIYAVATAADRGTGLSEGMSAALTGAERDAFVARVRAECAGLRRAAHESYRAAKERTR